MNNLKTYKLLALIGVLGAAGGALHAGNDSYYGLINLNVPATPWTLQLVDEKLDTSLDQALADYLKTVKLPKKQDVLGISTLINADGVPLKTFDAAPARVQLDGKTNYELTFSYGTAGLKSFHQVFLLYAKEQSAVLFDVASQATGSTLTISQIAQAEYNTTSKKYNSTVVNRDKVYTYEEPFDPTKRKPVFVYNVDGRLYPSAQAFDGKKKTNWLIKGGKFLTDN